jgi:pectate lyase
MFSDEPGDAARYWLACLAAEGRREHSPSRWHSPESGAAPVLGRRAGSRPFAVVVGIVAALAFPHVDATRSDPPLPEPTSTHSAAVPTGPQTIHGLLAQREGFGRKVHGGSKGRVVRVRTGADSGPGSLRRAVSGNRPAWIVFDRDMKIRLRRPLLVGSNKTIDGRSKHVTISAPGQGGLQLVGVSNVIIESLRLTHFGHVTQTKNNDPDEAIHLQHARKVWIDHNDLSRAGDKLVSVSGGSRHITISWNHFHHQEQVMQIGNQTTQDADAAQTVTIDHNFFDRTGYRNPVVSYGRAHVYNNYYLDWRLYAVRSERVAQVLLENNVFEGGRSRRVSLTTVQGDGCNDYGTRCDERDGYLRDEGNLTTDTRHIRDSEPELVFDPSLNYPYSAEPADNAMAERVATWAGPAR